MGGIHSEKDIRGKRSYFGIDIVSSYGTDVLDVQVPIVEVVIAEDFIVAQIYCADSVKAVLGSKINVLEELDVILGGNGYFILSGSQIGGQG